MKPVNIGGHSAYQDRVLTQLRKYYPNATTSLSPFSWQILDKFWNLDLSPIDDLMQDRYSVFGPDPRLPSCMLRSYLLALKLKVTSITSWCAACSGKLPFMQSLVVSLLEILPVSEPFMISFPVSGRMTGIIFLPMTVSLK